MDELESKVSEFREKGVGHVKIGFTDIDGVIRGKYVDLEKFYSLLKNLDRHHWLAASHVTRSKI